MWLLLSLPRLVDLFSAVELLPVRPSSLCDKELDFWKHVEHPEEYPLGVERRMSVIAAPLVRCFGFLPLLSGYLCYSRLLKPSLHEGNTTFLFSLTPHSQHSSPSNTLTQNPGLAHMKRGVKSLPPSIAATVAPFPPTILLVAAPSRALPRQSFDQWREEMQEQLLRVLGLLSFHFVRILPLAFRGVFFFRDPVFGQHRHDALSSRSLRPSLPFSVIWLWGRCTSTRGVSPVFPIVRTFGLYYLSLSFTSSFAFVSRSYRSAPRPHVIDSSSRYFD